MFLNKLTLIPLNLEMALRGRNALSALRTRKNPTLFEFAKLNEELIVETFNSILYKSLILLNHKHSLVIPLNKSYY